MQYEWGPWVEHDHTPCPLPVGTFVMVEFYGKWRGRPIKSGLLTPARVKAPDWTMDRYDNPIAPMVVRYRIRRPLVAEWLAGTTEDLPAPSPEQVNA